ncbi:MAG TPA: hypothetical protein VGJ84_20245 [Polyangiaceae bacterium]|jgi:hypothetical protein
MNRFRLLVVLLFVGCAGNPKTAAEAPEPDSAENETAAGSGSKERAESTSKSETGGAAAEEHHGTSGQSDVQSILQLVIDDEALDPYLHLGQPGRFPLAIAGPDVPQGLELLKATKPVDIVNQSESGKRAVLVFTKVSVTGNRAVVTYRYDVEKIKGTCNLTKNEGRWELTNSRITAHNYTPP